ncbi:hypothetical protein A2U01_0095396, partial [Trifolium medium]|nr:hypothetical protein [Trifolium medium]
MTPLSSLEPNSLKAFLKHSTISIDLNLEVTSIVVKVGPATTKGRRIVFLLPVKEEGDIMTQSLLDP